MDPFPRSPASGYWVRSLVPMPPFVAMAFDPGLIRYATLPLPA
jgi:hypothetical protein